MRGFHRFTVAAALTLAAPAAALAQAASPYCQQLEAQLASLDRGNDDPARAEQIRRAEDAVNKQQFEVDKLVAQSRRMDCERSGFFSIFRETPAQCGPLNRQVDQARSALDRLQMQLEQLQGGTTQRAAQRQSLLISLGQNNCGPQYRSAALQGQQGGFFDRLFGTNNNSGGGLFSPAPQQQQQPMGGTFRTICVRSCDGYYFPISYSTTPDRFAEDAQACQRLCPAAQASLYTYHNPGEDVPQAVSLDGHAYSELPTAFAYRKALNSACSCRKPGESWADALKTLGPDNTVEAGDVVVTEQNAKRLSQPRTGADGKPVKPDPRVAPTAEAQAPATPVETDPTKRKVRTVGPTFIPSN
jgi:Protein of unknown function (DUF2865)